MRQSQLRLREIDISVTLKNNEDELTCDETLVRTSNTFIIVWFAIFGNHSNVAYFRRINDIEKVLSI